MGGVARGFGHTRMQALIGQELRQARSLGLYIADRLHISVYIMGNEVGHAATPGRDRRHAARHRFQSCKAERFHFARQVQCMRSRYEPLHVILFAKKPDMRIHAQLSCQVLCRAAIRPITGHYEFGVDVISNSGERSDAVKDALDRPKVRDMQNTLPACGSGSFVRMIDSRFQLTTDD